MRIKPLIAVGLVGVAACGGGDASSDGEPRFLLADVTDDQAAAIMGEDFVACMEERMAESMEDLGVEQDAEPPAGGGLFAVAPDTDPLVLVDELEQMYRDCGDTADQAARLADAMVENGVPPELAECAVASGMAERVPRDFATRVVYGPESDEAAAVDGQAQAEMMRCGAPAVREQMRLNGFPDELIDCAIEQHLGAADDIEADPASVDVILGEAAGNARNARCLRVIPPASARGETASTAGTALLTAAVTDELTAHRLARFTSAQADCVARSLVGLVGSVQPVTAAELVDFLDGGYEPSELGLDVDEMRGAELAATAIECAGTEMLRMTTLFDGNIEDALGRPTEPAAENDELVECSFAAVDLHIVEAFLAQQFAHGPDAWRAPEARTLLEVSFAAVQECADDLGIPRQEPLNGI